MQRIKSSFYRFTRNDRATSFVCYLVPFTALGGYLLTLTLNNDIQSVPGYYLIHYLYTYDHGFVARGLVGEVISWFYPVVSDDLTQKVVILFSFLLMISAALCIGKALSKVKNNPRHLFLVAIISIVICVLPGSFRNYYPDVKLDKLLWALTLFSVLLVDKKYAIWGVPFLCIAATLVNPIFLFCSMILIAIILLQEFFSSGFSKKHGAICAICYISMIAVGIYALLSEKHLGFNTPDEMMDYYFSRYSGVLSDLNYAKFETEWLFDYFDEMDVIIKKAFQIYFIEWENWKVCLMDLIFLMIPVFGILTLFWKNCMSECENKFQKFIFFLCLISPVVIILPIVFSWESSKYFYNNLLVQLSLIIYYIARGNICVLKSVRKATDWIKANTLLSVCMTAYFTSLILA